MMYLIGMLIVVLIIIGYNLVGDSIKHQKEEKEKQEYKKRRDEYINRDVNIGDDLELCWCCGSISIIKLNKLFNLKQSNNNFHDGYIDNLFLRYRNEGIYDYYDSNSNYVLLSKINKNHVCQIGTLNKEDVIMLFITIEGYEDEKKYVLDEMNKKIEKINNREFEFEQIRKEKIESIKEQLDSKFDESDIKELKNKLN